MADVVTGEAVVVEVRIAQLPTRGVALLIDWVVQWAALILMYILLGSASVVTDTALATGLMILVTVLVLVGYPVAFETASRGRSLGKLAMGLRVVGDDGGPERFRQALFRGLAGFLEFWMFFGAPALITSLVNQRGKRLGDVFAGTIVISERGPRQEPPPEMPPGLAPWAASLQLSQLTGELADTARQYLSRWHQLGPDIRHQMGVRIAGQVSAVVAPPPPPGLPPHTYLAAVLAERRRREELRLAQARAAAPPFGAAYGGASYGSPYGGSPYDGAPYSGSPYDGAPYGGAPHRGTHGGTHGGAPQGGAPAPVNPPPPSDPAGPTPGGFVPPN
ncbi:RDD family protein [Microtetraspora malaysiensis]|uniref:RDD family protein n=1 Tax=Microtetraspora malaysiensis TaxID=161358 RepID=UPI000836622A|nr:RDD family protein [Microtetraspora malaysiensis]